LVFAPTGRDAPLACQVLGEAGILSRICTDLEDLRQEISHGAGAVVLTEETLDVRGIGALAEVFSKQLPWSDLPVLVFSSRESKADALTPAMRRLGSLVNLVLLDRPTRKISLVSAALSALRARARQYEVRDLLLRLETGVRDRDRFLAVLGHELRNPLSAILSSVQLIERLGAKALDREEAVILRQTRILSRLVDDLLDVSRVTSGKIALESAPVDIKKLLERCVQAQTISAAERRIEFSVDLEQGLAAQGDPVRLEQVFNNLLTNAVKYTPAGGRVRVTLARRGGNAEVRVQDTGVGIAPEVLPHVFDMFTQADDTLDRSQGGLGIGLTLVKSLVGLHGGSVAAESPGRGEGSTFIVRLPAMSSRARPATARSETPASPTPREILLVEDNPDVREGLKLLLEEAGHSVDVAADGIEALERIAERRPSLALLDIGLPRLDGYSLARRMREALGPSVYLVALTGYGLPEDRHRAMEAGFDAHLAKPITLDSLLALLARAEPARTEPIRADQRDGVPAVAEGVAPGPRRASGRSAQRSRT